MIPTLFVNQRTSQIIFWRIVQRQYFPKRLIPEYVSYDLYDAYRNVIDVLSLYYGDRITLGLHLLPESLQFLKDNHLYLSGNSLGFAWLIALVAHLEHISLPTNWFAWGSVLPTRSGAFVLNATCHTNEKVKLSLKHHVSCIFAHQDERIDIDGKKHLYSGDMLSIINALKEDFLDEQTR